MGRKNQTQKNRDTTTPAAQEPVTAAVVTEPTPVAPVATTVEVTTPSGEAVETKQLESTTLPIEPTTKPKKSRPRSGIGMEEFCFAVQISDSLKEVASRLNNKMSQSAISARLQIYRHKKGINLKNFTRGPQANKVDVADLNRRLEAALAAKLAAANAPTEAAPATTETTATA